MALSPEQLKGLLDSLSSVLGGNSLVTESQPPKAEAPQVQPEQTSAQPAALPAPTQANQPNTRIVKEGETLSGIAQELGVPVNQITGFRSGDPNIIFPGERLTVLPTPAGQQAQAPAPLPAPVLPTAQPSQATVVEAGQPAEEEAITGQTTTPSGAVVDAQTGELITPPAEPAPGIGPNPLADYGLAGDFRTLSIDDVITKVSQAFGLSGINSQLQTLDDEFIEESQAINDNPWISAGTKKERTRQIQDRYEKRRDGLVNRLRLQESVIGKSLDVYYKERGLAQDLLETQLKARSEELDRQAKALQGTGLTEEIVGGFRVLKDATGKVISTKALAEEFSGFSPKQITTSIQLSNSLKSHPAYSDITDIATGMQGVQTGLAQQNGFGDITAINAFQRMVDPGATVRSEDVTLLQGASAFIFKVLSDYPIERLSKGAKLPDPVRKQMMKTAQDLYETRARNYNNTVGNQYRKLSEAANLPFELVGQDFPTSTSGFGIGAAITEKDKTAELDALLSGSDVDIQSDPSGFFDSFLSVFGLEKSK